MLSFSKRLLNHQRIRQLSDPRNIALYIFGIIVLAITWSGVKTVQSNYQLQKKISALSQQNSVLKLQNENAGLQNKYYQTDQYLELAARQDFGLAAPGETVLLMPSRVAMKYVDPTLRVETKSNSKPIHSPADSQAWYVKNIEDWRDFLLGRKLSER